MRVYFLAQTLVSYTDRGALGPVTSAEVSEDDSGDSITYRVSLRHATGAYDLTRSSSGDYAPKRVLVDAINRFLGHGVPVVAAPPPAEAGSVTSALPTAPLSAVLV